MLYPDTIEQKIGFDEIRKLLKGHCISKLGVERVDRMNFMTGAEDIRLALQQVIDMNRLLETEDQLPGEDFFDFRPSVRKLRVDNVYLEEQELWELKRSLVTMHSWIDTIQNAAEEDVPFGITDDREPSTAGAYPALLRLSEGVFTFHQITRQIEQILDKYGHIKDEASPELMRIRREIRYSEGSINKTLVSILEGAKREGLIEKNVMPTMREGRLMIPISPAMKRRIRGIVHDESATGKTVFIEPSAVVEANNHIRELEAEERREIIKILTEMSDRMRPNLPELFKAADFLSEIEFVLAKQRLGQQLDAHCIQPQGKPLIDWTLARHPILEMNLKRQGRKVVPLEIELSSSQRMLIISGPNAGGKSVCLKTVGLLQYMLQCGLPITAGANSQTGVFTNMFIDIGDQQSIDDDLSTYSSHLLNMKVMMKNCSPTSLLLIDELGSGTEPTIGGALAEAILKRLVERGSYGVVTTHYHNLKQFAREHKGVINGAMLYDRQKMQALFQLQIGSPGSSFAVEIARKIGIPEDVISGASEIVGKEYINADQYLLDITRDKRYWENKRQAVHGQKKEMDRLVAHYEQEIAELQRKRKEIIEEAKQQAQQIIQQSNAKVEGVIREIREAQADKQRTREVREELSAFRNEISDALLQHKEDLVSKKMHQLEERRKRKEERRSQKDKTPANAQTSGLANLLSSLQKPTSVATQERIMVGSTVRIKGQNAVGKVEDINGKRASVLFGMIRTVVDLKKIEPAQELPQPRNREQQPASLARALGSSYMHKANSNFSQEIDIRGMRADEALDTIIHYIDDAILVGAHRVRILHGTGTGALRQLVRQYMNSVRQVLTAHDEDVRFGGAGITVVEFRY